MFTSHVIPDIRNMKLFSIPFYLLKNIFLRVFFRFRPPSLFPPSEHDIDRNDRFAFLVFIL